MQANEAKAKAIFDGAYELSGEERTAYLERACGGDGALHDRVKALLAGAETSDAFLSDPGMGSPGRRDAWSEGPGAVIGRYKLLRVVGEGGFGRVFLAEQEQPIRRQVALKVIKLGMDTRAVIGRFEQERQALAVMDHPNIAKVLDAGTTATGRPYFVMEFVRGVPITEYCDRNRLSVPERLDLFGQMCDAVQHAHTKGIIHRDIKPGNVLVVEQDGRRVVKVIDFGIAKAMDRAASGRTQFTGELQLVGTPEYMSPEQAEGSRDIDTRTDVYSLGVVLYELLAGTPPFDARTLRSAAYHEIQRIIREVEPPAPSTRLAQASEALASVAAQRRTEPARLGAMLRGELDWIVMRALEKERGRRYESAGALAADVRRHLAGEAVQAAPPSGAYRVRKFVRRHRVGVGFTLAAGALLVLGIVGTTAGLLRASDQRDRAVQAEANAKLEAERSETVALFLTDMLRGVQPAAAQGRDTSVLREIMDKTIDRLNQGELADQPVVEADIRHVVGVVLSDLGDAERAIRMQRDALALRIKATGEESEDTTLSMNDLGKALWADGQYKEAEQVLRRALEIRKKNLGPDHPYVAISMNNVAMLMKANGDLPGAAAMLKDAVAIRRKTDGPRSEKTAGSLGNLALVHYEMGDYGPAEAYAREALDIAREATGPNHPFLADALSYLAMILNEKGDAAAALPMLEEALAIRRKVYAPDHEKVGAGAENLAACLQKQGEAGGTDACERAIVLFREALEIARKDEPRGGAWTARILFGLGRCLVNRSRFAEAEAAARECLEMRTRLIADDSPAYWARLTAKGLLGAALAGQGRYAEAEAELKDAAEKLGAIAKGAPGDADGAARAAEAAKGMVRLYEAWEAAEPGKGIGARAGEWKK